MERRGGPRGNRAGCGLAGEECHEVALIGIACTGNEVGAQRGGGIEAGRLWEAAGDGDAGGRRKAADGADELARLGIGDVGDGAGVDDVGVGFAEAIEDVVAGGAEAVGDLLGIGQVEFAAKGEHGSDAWHGYRVRVAGQQGEGQRIRVKRK